jgi:hypothetical protein
MTRAEMINFHMALATGNDAGAGAGLTAWRNGDVKYASGELIPCDIPLAWGYKPTHYSVARTGAMSTSRVSDAWSTTRNMGTWRSKHAFQTCQFIFWLMQTTGTPTTEGTPVGYNTHALTIGNVTTPDWHGIHFEREDIALRYDLMGLLPSDLIIECGNTANNWMATQEIIVPFANKVAGDDITAQTQRPRGTTGTIWKSFDHLVTGNGAGTTANMTGLLYNGNSLEVDVLRNRIHLHRDVAFDVPDTNGLYTVGSMMGWDYSIELDVHIQGDALPALNEVKPESYAGELDFDFYYNANNTNDKIRFVFDKMQLVPYDELNDYKQHFEGYTITLIPLDTTSSLTVTGIDGLDNTHFENP